MLQQELPERRFDQGKILIVCRGAAGITNDKAVGAYRARSICRFGAVDHLQAESVAVHPGRLTLLAHVPGKEFRRSDDGLAGIEGESLPVHLFLVESGAQRVRKIRAVDPPESLRLEDQVVHIQDEQSSPLLPVRQQAFDIAIHGDAMKDNHPCPAGFFVETRVSDMR